jgi:hypothetical protein
MRSVMNWVLAGGLVMVVGCSDGARLDRPEGEDDDVAEDVDGGAAPPLPEPEAVPPGLTTITGRWFTRCRTGAGFVDRLFDLRTSRIRALIPDDSAAGYRVVQGAGREDSTFSIPGVPRNLTYVLNLGIGYYVTDQRVIDAHNELPARCEPLPELAQEATPVTFDLEGMTPSTSGAFEHISIESRALHLVHYGITNREPLRPGDSAIHSTIDWGEGNGLPESSQGDDVYVTHWRSAYDRDPRNQRAAYLTRMVDLFQTRDLSLQSGVPGALAGSFTRLTADRTLSLSVDVAPFYAGYGTGFQPLGLSARLVTDRGHQIARADLFDRARSTSTVHTVNEGAYADPFPSSWERRLVVNYLSDRYVRAPGGGMFSTNINNWQSVPYTGQRALSPVIHAPAAVQIAGMAFDRGGPVPFDGVSPVTMRWNEVPAATSYRVTVYLLDAQGFEASVALFRTTGTSLRMPASLFEDGRFYVFRFETMKASNDYRNGHILPVDVTATIDLVSARFRFGSRCGDGVVQPDEECDAAGESDTCNADCTAASCGDTIWNASAGESCDDGSSSLGCDRDCTLSVCGDGAHNYLTEGCDDGDAIDSGNGCGSDCMRNNVCGNRIVEPIVETCDEGGVDTAVCNSNCSRSFCGDGYLNRAAGEECDDGSFDHRRCGTTCRLLGP